MKKFHCETLGCKVNQYETRSIAEAWESLGMERCEDPAEADVILVNTCSVTANAVRDLRRLIRRFRKESPDALIVAAGCAVQAGGGDLAGVDPAGNLCLVPQDRKDTLLQGPPDSTSPLPKLSEQAEPARWSDFQVSGYDRARGVVKVQDGCSHHCTYCIVPLTRGPSISRPPREVAAEIRRLLEAGFRELTINGINLRHYGRGLSGEDAKVGDFWGLMRFLEKDLTPEWTGRARLRLSSLDPGQLNDEAVQCFAENSLVCPHVHLSLQSLDDTVLKRMGRGHYSYADAAAFVDRLSGRLPLFALGADLLTGFPGETREQFETTLARVESLPLTYAHVFPYSRRPGTPADSLPGQVDTAEKKERAGLLRKVVNRKKKEFAHQLLETKSLTVAAETLDPMTGHCEYYVTCEFKTEPDNPQERALFIGAPAKVKKGVLILDPQPEQST